MALPLASHRDVHNVHLHVRKEEDVTKSRYQTSPAPYQALVKSAADQASSARRRGQLMRKFLPLVLIKMPRLTIKDTGAMAVARERGRRDTGARRRGQLMRKLLATLNAEAGLTYPFGKYWGREKMVKLVTLFK